MSFPDPWPFRSNHKNYPTFMGIYDSTLWNEICELQLKSRKGGSCTEESLEPAPSAKQISSPAEESLVEKAENVHSLVKDLIDFITENEEAFQHQNNERKESLYTKEDPCIANSNKRILEERSLMVSS